MKNLNHSECLITGQRGYSSLRGLVMVGSRIASTVSSQTPAVLQSREHKTCSHGAVELMKGWYWPQELYRVVGNCH